MAITSVHRKGATSFLALALAALLPGPVQGEVATAQIFVASAVEQSAAKPVPAVIVEDLVIDNDVAEVAKSGSGLVEGKKLAQKKTLGKSTILGEGMASFYGAELAGNKTANGERFNPAAMTAAHRTLPMGTRLRVTNKSNGKSVVVRINDRGPFAKSRIIDLSRGAAEKISMVRSGTARVTIERIG